MRRLKYLLALLALANVALADSTDIRFVSATPTLTASPDYSTGDLMGDAVLTFTAAVPSKTGQGTIVSIQISDLSGQNGNMDLVLFQANPTGTTFTDNSAFAIADADVPKILAVVNFGSASHFAFSDNGTSYLGSLAIPVQARSSSGAIATTIYGALVSRGTINIAGASDIVVKLGIVGN